MARRRTIRRNEREWFVNQLLSVRRQKTYVKTLSNAERKRERRNSKTGKVVRKGGGRYGDSKGKADEGLCNHEGAPGHIKTN